MKKYIGTKTIMAKPMAKSEAEKVLNRSLADAKGGEDGYLVEYPDGPSGDLSESITTRIGASVGDSGALVRLVAGGSDD